MRGVLRHRKVTCSADPTSESGVWQRSTMEKVGNGCPLTSLVNCTGNPRVFLAVPVPVPVAGSTHEPAGFPVKTSPRSSKMVKY
jgi:hypothetical protein